MSWFSMHFMWQNIRKTTDIDFCDANEDGGAVHRCLHAIMHLIEDHAIKHRIPVRFAAAKLVEGDQLLLETLNLDQNEREMLWAYCQADGDGTWLDRSSSNRTYAF